MKKIFVIDTNVILYDPESIYAFQDNDIIIPIVVLEELDNIKNGTDTVNFQAREFIRDIERLTVNKYPVNGISLGEGKGNLFIETGKWSDKVAESFSEKTPDHRILAIADYVNKNKSQYNKDAECVILISKDVNFRSKARSIGIRAEDYETGKVQDIDSFEKKTRIIDKLNDEDISVLYGENPTIEADKIRIKKKPHANEYFILKGENSNALVKFKKDINSYVRVEKKKAYGIEPRNAEQTFSLDALLDPSIQLVSLTGKAGTGKTLLALSAAIHQRKEYCQILLARPIVALSNRDLGFLPGDVNDKIGPYMIPLFDNLSVIKNSFPENAKERKTIEEMLNLEKLMISPLAYIRGRSLNKIFFIIDEAQNLTPHEIKTIITRAGEGTKIVFTGDVQQIDNPLLDVRSNGLSYFTDRMKGESIFAHVNLIKGERSYLAELAAQLL